MVLCNTLVHRSVKIKFSQAPQQLNISFYSVELVEKPSNKTINVIKSHNKAVDMLTAEFLSVPSGNYVAIVKPSSENCLGTATNPFQVGNPMHGKKMLFLNYYSYFFLIIYSYYLLYMIIFSLTIIPMGIATFMTLFLLLSKSPTD